MDKVVKFLQESRTSVDPVASNRKAADAYANRKPLSLSSSNSSWNTSVNKPSTKFPFASRNWPIVSPPTCGSVFGWPA